ncbi:MAG: hypothetical protein J6B34_02260 [Clostridia bacterium]|nr:hypothetical protein [Clostridia bacterium]
MEKSLKTAKVLKFVGTIVYVAMTVFLVVALIYSIPRPDPDAEIDLSKLGYVLAVIIYSIVGFFVYLIPTILGIVGIFITRKKIPEEKKRSNAIYFTLMATLPLLTDALCFCTIFLLK